jgi:hypothetical protein
MEPADSATTTLAKVFENWNRYYDPAIGNYLQPEPLLQHQGVAPAILAKLAGRPMASLSQEEQELLADYALEQYGKTPEGRDIVRKIRELEMAELHSSGPYSYARNNPLHYIDKDGRKTVEGPPNFDQCQRACHTAFVACEIVALAACIPEPALPICIPLASIPCTTAYAACLGNCKGLPHEPNCEHQKKK